MAILGRSRRLRCFYCNQWTPRPRQQGPVRQLRCQHCEAVNYFDENGDITDPPVQSTTQTSSTPRYARTLRSRSRSPPPFRSSDFVFCETCRKNQHMLASALANVDPPPEKSPRYADFEAHVRQLEARYPQVCQACRPRARHLIKESIYHAKADNMLKIMERTQVARANGLTAFGYAWRSWLLWLSGLGWLVSLLVQLAWHVLGARVREPPNFTDVELFAWDALERTTWAGAVSTVRAQLLGPAIDPRLFVLASFGVPASLVSAALTLWWNPRLRKKYLKFGRGRMVGTRDYYAMQLVLLALRTAGYLLLRDPSTTHTTLATFKRAHTILAVTTAFLALRSLPLVRLDTRPPVDFKTLRDEDILPDTPAPAAAMPNNPLLRARAPAQPAFDIALLAPQSATPRAAPPPALQQPRWPTAYIEQPRRTPSLPPDPMDLDVDTPRAGPGASAAYNLRSRAPRRPSTPTDTTRASDDEASLAGTSTAATTTAADDDDDDDDDAMAPAAAASTARRTGRATGKSGADMHMAPTRLWLAADRADTGLEDMFAQVLGGSSFAADAPGTPATSTHPHAHAAARADRERARGGGGGAWAGSLAAVGAPLAILGGVWAAVKGLR